MKHGKDIIMISLSKRRSRNRLRIQVRYFFKENSVADSLFAGLRDVLSYGMKYFVKLGEIMRRNTLWKALMFGGVFFLSLQTNPASASLDRAEGTIDPLTIPKFVTPLVIPPEMPRSTIQPGAPSAMYNIAVRQFKQQILPGGIWNTLNGRHDSFGPTTVWSYGRAEDGVPDSSGIAGGAVGIAPAPNSSFNYPSFTVENISGRTTTVRWINDLVDADGNYLPHLFAVDQTLHWANPPATGCMDGTNRSDCATMKPAPYTGPVPLVTHLHGAHVNPQSDGYPEAWWLPAAKNIPPGYAKHGDIYDQYNRANKVPGSAFYAYENTQPATTLWFHDHALGMTRLNVYAGPAGFWVIRNGGHGDSKVKTAAGGLAVLPGHRPTTTDIGDPNFNQAVRARIREIPIVIQDRTFKTNGDLFYPDNRAYFEDLNKPGAAPQFTDTSGKLDIPFIGDMHAASDIPAIWNPEAFFHTMVVNGTTWPYLDVAPALYRFRLLNGCNSRYLNLSLAAFNSEGERLGEVPFYMVGSEQGFFPRVVRIVTGQAVRLTPGAVEPDLPESYPARGNKAALLMGPAFRSDVLVDFAHVPEGTVKVRMINNGPDIPFGGFPIDPADMTDARTTGKVMEFRINKPAFASDALTTAPKDLVLPFEHPISQPVNHTRQVSLNELESNVLCTDVAPDGSVSVVPGSTPPECAGGGQAFGPRVALLGTVDTTAGTSTPLHWMEPITEDPFLGDTEIWEIYNMTMDGHPIHLHLVRFEVVNRQPLKIDSNTMEPIPVVDESVAPQAPSAWEIGFHDMVTALPGTVTRIKAHFDIVGTYVWHCHIVEHEDNEMMRPYHVRLDPNNPDINQDGAVDVIDLELMQAEVNKAFPRNPGYDLNGDGKVDILDVWYLLTKLHPAEL